MSGRRSHPRFSVAAPWEGAMRVMRDVIVQRSNEEEFLAVSHAPGIVGEDMSLDLIGAGASVALKVRVLESRPVIVNGSVRHRLRLGLVGSASLAVGSVGEGAAFDVAAGASPAEAV